MAAAELTLHNEAGLHARPAALFVQAAARLASDIEVENLDRPGQGAVNGKSILEVLTLGAGRGQRIRITARGASEAADLDVLLRLLESGLGDGAAEDAGG